jgi:hypothetical protein
MKAILRLSIIAAGVGCVWVALLYAQALPPRGEPDKDRTKWVDRCLGDFEFIKVGMRRAEIEGRLSKDGGLQVVSPVRFAHPACGYFKIDVEFDFKRNAADQNRAMWGKDDKATKVSKPYIERPFVD